MRMLLLISAAGFLAACNPPSNDEPGQFETIALSVIENPACVFTPIDSEGVAFATYQDNPDFMAVARFGGERSNWCHVRFRPSTVTRST